ncbi:hypothetical protein [Xenorhabdus entomophaga]|uniref:hypothetical protein n=1 Tax=Xenorhabdus entomophaga TaxID=3136257 RepID=UPI0030F48970
MSFQLTTKVEHRVNRVYFDVTRMSQIQLLWAASNYRGVFKDWAAADLTLRFPEQEQIIQGMINSIYLQDPSTFAFLYNRFF